MTEHSQPPVNAPETAVFNEANQGKTLVQFEKIARGQSEVLVEHEGQIYRLRLTRNGKLILNK